MEGELLLTIGEDGKARLYDDTYDITIHCESQEEQDRVCTLLKHIPNWIPCSERLPETGTDVLISFHVAFSFVAEGCLRPDGKWWSFRQNAVIDHEKAVAWKPLPEPYKGEKDG